MYARSRARAEWTTRPSQKYTRPSSDPRHVRVTSSQTRVHLGAFVDSRDMANTSPDDRLTTRVASQHTRE